MEKLYNTCMELKAISSTKDKKKFLEAHKDDEDFGKLLQFLFNPLIVTGISKAKLKKKLTKHWWTVEVYDLNWLYMYFRNNNTGRDSDIDLCQQYIAHYGRDYEDFISSIITKTLKIGVDVKLCNTVYGRGFIPVHEVMLGSPRDKLRLKNGEVFYLSQKLNGTRASFTDDKLISRQGIPFTNMNHIINELKEISNNFGQPMFFDGELIRKNIDNIPDNENFRIGTGLINSNEEDKTAIEFVIFDIFPLAEFKNGESKNKYSIRHKMLCELDKNLHSTNIRIVPIFYQGDDINMIDYWLDYADSHNYEGCMLNKDAVYECKRSTNLIKIKSFKHSDLRIIGYEEGTGKYVDMLGSIIVDYKGNTVSVGSGLSDEQRIEYWKNPDSLIGKIVQVKFKETSVDKKTGLESLQFPIFEFVREDKTEPSYE